jgi:FtsH-binding integral membrane protein
VHGDRTAHTVILTLTILGVLGVVIISVVLAFAGFTKFGVIVLALFALQAFYGWTLYRRLPRPDIAALQHEPPDEPADEA